MEVALKLCSLSIFILIVALNKFLFRGTRNNKLPPSPPDLPFIGHLHLLKEPLHRTLHAFSEKYGPIFSLRLGSRFVLVVSSPSGVEECFNKNDIIFANRPAMIIGDYIGYDNTVMSLISYSTHWGNLRRLCAIDIFSSNRISASMGIRRDEINILLHKLYKVSRTNFVDVNLKSIFMEVTFNVITRMLFGKRYYGEDVSGVEEAEKFKWIVRETLEVAGAGFPGDYLPIFKWIDFTGNMKRIKRVGKELDPILQGLVDYQRQNKGNPECANTMVNRLLALQESQPEYYTDEIIKGLVEVMIIAGTDTSAVTMEWAMANLLNHPDILQKAREEINSQIEPNKLIDEQDLSKLPYINDIISETLRLYPAVPLLLPHSSSSDCTIGGYDIPRDTMLLVNAWAIQRNPKYWDDATSFRPERFESLKSKEGVACKMLPYGVGRRSCPGAGLGNRIVGLVLASLIQCFEWERPNNKEIDMVEGTGLTMPKAVPLVAMCKARSSYFKQTSFQSRRT